MIEFKDFSRIMTSRGELARAYDNLGRLIWQAGPPVLWQGSWKISTSALNTTIDIAKYPTLLLQFAQTITYANVKGSSTSLLITNGMINLPVKDVIAAGGSVNIGYSGGGWSYTLLVSGNLTIASDYSSTDAPVLTTIYGITN